MKLPFTPSALYALFFLLALNGNAQPDSAGHYSRHGANRWFRQRDWLDGLAFTPHPAIDRKEFCRQYHLHKNYWDKAFSWLKEQNLMTLQTGRHDIDGMHGENVYAMVQEGPTHEYAKTRWESHRKYIDMQLVLTGTEEMAVLPVDKALVTNPYNEASDLAIYSGEGKSHIIHAGEFILFFPYQAHRPNIFPGEKGLGNAPNGRAANGKEDRIVRKIVVKVRVADNGGNKH